ncbi:MAG: hypothetical protein A3G76_08090 [Acidobacteria bacterium RIFCSPLOWO2_12_FULL_65_11]|nr:MAG: hypothetical protein A3H95_05355 [Acidobacteria bacterium RIFCSPLOWO2_02_FULL_64_15]OFW28367.1 MAG: hypothetical protein A3G76_08090 [Acidobacteria bacterium RIFCSPLOWO2_12_FULL_65_11]
MRAVRDHYVLIGVAALLLLQGTVLFLLGQPVICTCGYVKAWEGVVLSSGTAQHLTDWYTFSHVIHGVLFYAVSWWLFPHWSLGSRLLLAMGAEIAWEIAENTPWVIQAYRQQALAQGYVGDSVINSVFDTFSMMLGFAVARMSSVWATFALAVVFEVWVAYVIRDNLTLNILNFIHQFDFIHRWQSGG